MRETIKAIVPAALGAALWLLWGYEHEATSIRAPWTGITFAAAGAAFVLAGVVGRGWRALLASALAAVAAVLLADPLVRRGEPLPPGVESDCDPGCISVEAAAAAAALAAGLLAALGIVLRRVLGRR